MARNGSKEHGQMNASQIDRLEDAAEKFRRFDATIAELEIAHTRAESRLAEVEADLRRARALRVEARRELLETAAGRPLNGFDA